MDISFEKLWQINLEMKRFRLVREIVDSVADFREMEVLILPWRSPPSTVVGMPTFLAHKVSVPGFRLPCHVLLTPFSWYLFHFFGNLQPHGSCVFLILANSCPDLFNSQSPYLHCLPTCFHLAHCSRFTFLQDHTNSTEW